MRRCGRRIPGHPRLGSNGFRAWRVRRKRSGEQQGARGGARLLFNKAEERGGRSHDARHGRRLLQHRVRAVAEPRGEGDGADKWGQAVSGCGREEGAAAGLAVVLGRRLAGRARLGAGGGRKQRRWAGAEEWASRPKELGHGPKIKKGGKNGFFFFFFFYTFPNPFLNSNFNSF